MSLHQLDRQQTRDHETPPPYAQSPDSPFRARVRQRGHAVLCSICGDGHHIKEVVPQSMSLKGAFGSRALGDERKVEAPHSFRFCSRSGMSPSLLTNAVERLPGGVRKHDRDLFCCVKQNMADAQLSQPPLLVMPGEWADESAVFCRALAKPGGPVCTWPTLGCDTTSFV